MIDIVTISHTINGIIDERGNGRRPNLADIGKGRPSRSD